MSDCSDDDYVYEDDEEKHEMSPSDQYQYEYSSQDEDDENCHHSDGKASLKFHVPDGDYKILLYKDIQPMMESHTRDVSNLLSIDYDIANILLRKYKWNQERLIDVYYTDTEEILKEAGVSRQGSPLTSSSTPSPSASSTPIRCRICGDLFAKDDCYSLLCEHYFCKSCYGTYLTHQVNDGPPLCPCSLS